ncbi:retrotransposon protein, putative, ty1-copia subclass [Tanacetum coccineum]
MAQKPYSHQVERAKDLLGLIHTDVCGPFRIVSRQGASYFVTFTDDFSRYGYVYLLKHKHEVFETFKVFQKELENQLGKTIKSLRFDHGGEYMSQEFLDHLKEYVIIAHHTPPYTPQHNGVSKRRNRTLLDMVRSMMSQTTLPKSFWDYALESAAHILNMVPTKRVEKTPYEDPKFDKWLIAMNVEMQSMKDNEVWNLVDLPPNGKIIGSKWLFKKKTNMDGAVHTYKACLVVKGFTQTLGIDYKETFSPIVDIRAIRILIAITAFYDYEIW